MVGVLLILGLGPNALQVRLQPRGRSTLQPGCRRQLTLQPDASQAKLLPPHTTSGCLKARDRTDFCDVATLIRELESGDLGRTVAVGGDGVDSLGWYEFVPDGKVVLPSAQSSNFIDDLPEMRRSTVELLELLDDITS